MSVLELAVCVLCLAGFVSLFFGSLAMPYPQSFWDGPGAFPVVLSVILSAVCVIWLFDLLKAARRAGTRAAGTDGSSAAAERGKTRREQRSFLIIGVLTILYIMVLMPLLPFPLATFVFLSASFLLFAKSAWWKSLLLSAIVSAVLFLIFMYVLHLPMPR